MVDKAFEDAKNTHCDDRLFSVVSASDFEIYDEWLRMDERNMTPAEKRKLAALVEQMPTDLARGLRYGKTLSYVADMVQDGLSKGAWIFVGNEPESALEFNVSALTKDGYLTDEHGLAAQENDFKCLGNLSGSMTLLNQTSWCFSDRWPSWEPC